MISAPTCPESVYQSPITETKLAAYWALRGIKVVMTTCAQQFLRMQTGNILKTFLRVYDYERCPSENIEHTA